MFKNYRISSIIDLLNTKKKISNSKLMQISRKIKLQQIYTTGKTILNFTNPVYWFRKLAIKPATVLVTKKFANILLLYLVKKPTRFIVKLYLKEDSEEEIMSKLEKMIESEDAE